MIKEFSILHVFTMPLPSKDHLFWPAFSPHVTVFLNKEVPYRSRIFRFDLEYASRNVQENKETDIEWVTSTSGQYKCHTEEK
jgi:hypothetical protein